MKSLKARLYVAVTADIEVLTREYLAGVTAMEDSRRTYLTVLIATTQDEVGASPRERAGKPGKLTDEEIVADVRIMRMVHKRFFKIIVATAHAEGLKGPELDRKVKKFCSSASTFKAFIKAGGDLRALVATRETKYSLQKATKPVAEKPNQLERAIGRYARGAEKLAKACTPKNINETLKALGDLRSRVLKIEADLAARLGSERKSQKQPTKAFMPSSHRAADSAHATG